MASDNIQTCSNPIQHLKSSMLLTACLALGYCWKKCQFSICCVWNAGRTTTMLSTVTDSHRQFSICCVWRAGRITTMLSTVMDKSFLPKYCLSSSPHPLLLPTMWNLRDLGRFRLYLCLFLNWRCKVHAQLFAYFWLQIII